MQTLADLQQEELKSFNENMDLNFFKITKYYDEQEPILKEQQQNEIHEKIEQINLEFSKQLPKPNGEILKIQKTLELLVKQKEYIKAHEIQIKLNELQNVDTTKQQDDRERKIKKELDKLRVKHDNENNNFNLKLNQTYTEFKKKRALELER